MASVKSSLVLNDRMSGALQSINKALNLVIDNFEAVQRVSGNSINVANINAARQELGRANAVLEDMERNYMDCNEQQNMLNDNMSQGVSAANGLNKAFKAAIATLISYNAGKWFADSMNMYNTQHNAEVQLKTVLANMGAEADAYDLLKQKAYELQKVTMYSDTALLGGAAEFATYMSDPDAIAKMMDTLTNYAAGMSNGAPVDYEKMVDLATGLGKMMNGNYQAMSDKGFKVTEAQKEIIKNGSDMEKALAIEDVINESWAELAKNMAQTPLGRMEQIKNAFASARKELISALYPAIMNLLNLINDKSSRLHEIMTRISEPLTTIINILVIMLDAFVSIYDYVVENWSWIGPIIYGIIAAMILYNVILGIVTVAQAAYNAVMYANPVVWIVLAVVALIAAIIAVTLIILNFADTVGGCAAVGVAAIWNVILVFGKLGLAAWQIIKNIGIWFINLGRDIGDVITNVRTWFKNVGAGIWEVMKACASNIGIAFNNGWINIQVNFWRMVDALMQGLKSIAELANKVLGWMGVNIDTSGLDFAAKKIDELNSKKESYNSIADAWAEGASTYSYTTIGDNHLAYGSVSDAFNSISAFEEGWAEAAYNTGASIGSSVKGWADDNLSIDGIMKNLGLSGTDDLSDEEWKAKTGGMADDVADISENTGKSSEELSYLRDIAEKEAINRFTTAEIKIDMSGMSNRIDSNLDIDGIITYLTDGLSEALSTAAEGVY